MFEDFIRKNVLKIIFLLIALILISFVILGFNILQDYYNSTVLSKTTAIALSSLGIMFLIFIPLTLAFIWVLKYKQDIFGKIRKFCIYSVMFFILILMGSSRVTHLEGPVWPISVFLLFSYVPFMLLFSKKKDVKKRFLQSFGLVAFFIIYDAVASLINLYLRFNLFYPIVIKNLLFSGLFLTVFWLILYYIPTLLIIKKNWSARLLLLYNLALCLLLTVFLFPFFSLVIVNFLTQAKILPEYWITLLLIYGLLIPYFIYISKLFLKKGKQLDELLAQQEAD